MKVMEKVAKQQGEILVREDLRQAFGFSFILTVSHAEVGHRPQRSGNFSLVGNASTRTRNRLLPQDLGFAFGVVLVSP